MKCVAMWTQYTKRSSNAMGVGGRCKDGTRIGGVVDEGYIGEERGDTVCTHEMVVELASRQLR